MPQEFLRDVLRTGDATGAQAARLVGVATLNRGPCGCPHGVPVQSVDERGGVARVASPLPEQSVETVAPSPPVCSAHQVLRLPCRRRITSAPTEAPSDIIRREPGTAPRSRSRVASQTVLASRLRSAAAQRPQRCRARYRHRQPRRSRPSQQRVGGAHPRTSAVAARRAALSRHCEDIARRGHRRVGGHPRCDRQSRERSSARLTAVAG